MRAPSPALRVEELEIRLLQDALVARWGLDFRRWAAVPFRRRVRAFARARGVANVSELVPRVVHDPAWRDALVAALSRQDVALFRDPGAWLALRHKALPVLRTWPRIRWWLPATGTGEDLWALCIVLQEEGLWERSRVYATDLSETLLHAAREGREGPIPEAWVENHRAAGGKTPLERWLRRDDGRIALDPALVGQVAFARHDPGSPGTHNAFHAIVFRNALVSLDEDAAEGVREMLWRSLVPFGMLLLGRRERLGNAPSSGHFGVVDAEERLYRRVR